MSEEAVEKGRVLKVLYFDDKGEPIGEWKSAQMPDDPFESKNIHGLQDPPYSLEQLVFLAELHPIHAAALEQKTADVIGTGWQWVGRTGEEDLDEELRDELTHWFEGLAGDGEETMHELLTLAEQDQLTVGHGALEIARDTNGIVKRLFHIPAHTVRFHRDGVRVCQVRGQKTVWFKRWGAPTEQDVHRARGSLQEPGKLDDDDRGNEVLIIQKPSRRSSWYGIPTYMSSVGWITLALAARDDNLLFFSNRREPRYAVIMSNLQDTDDLEESLRQAFAVDLKQPHRNLLIPITGKGEIKFEKLSSDRQDGSFERLSERADAAILVSHRLPPERLGLSKVGPLGGNVVNASSRVYKEAVVAPEQARLSARINRFIEVEFKRAATTKSHDKRALPWKWCPVELDLAEEAEDLRQAVAAFGGNVITLREARKRVGLGPLMKKLDGMSDAEKSKYLEERGKESTDDDEIEDERNDQLFVDLQKGVTQQPGFADPWASPYGGGFSGGFDPYSSRPQDQQFQPDDQGALEEIQMQLRELILKTDNIEYATRA